MNSQSKHFFIVLMTASFLSTVAVAQQLNVSSANNAPFVEGQTKLATFSQEVINTRSDYPAAVITNYPKVVTHFSTLFPDAESAEWTQANNALYASFVNNGRKTRASFTKNGLMNYAIANCTLEQLPASLQRYIQTNYHGYTLFNGIEINTPETVSYQAILESADDFITLRSTSEGIEKIKKVNKGSSHK